MSANNHASYVKIGLAVVLGALATVCTLVYIAGWGGDENAFLVETYYDRPVNGLTVGSAVNFRGVPIGEVCRVAFVRGVYAEEAGPEDFQRISIVMSIDRTRIGADSVREVESILRRFLDRGLRATVSTSGLTGLSRIELNVQENPHPVASLSWRPEHMLIPPHPSLMENFSSAATRALNHLNRMDMASILSNVQQTAASAARFADRLNVLAGDMEGDVRGTLGNVGALAESVRTLVDKLSENPSLLLRPYDPVALPETSR